jgi:alginate O-acetyltransferase complex protein AlgI
MWGLAAALWLGLKWLTVRDARGAGLRPGHWRWLGYSLAWPGMDARAFLDVRRIAAPGPRREWLASLACISIGAALIWGVAPTVVPAHPLAGGWAAMTGIVLLLHFSAFHLLSLLWRRAGVDAPPIMDEPLLAGSSAELWGARWNRAFSDPARRFIFGPLARRWGIVPATVAVFLASGLAHEAVISVPARAGYGLPTAYFAIQAAAVLLGRTAIARRIGIARGPGARLVAIAAAVGPICILFPPPFVHAVVLPMLRAIGAA